MSSKTEQKHDWEYSSVAECMFSILEAQKNPPKMKQKHRAK